MNSSMKQTLTHFNNFLNSYLAINAPARGVVNLSTYIYFCDEKYILVKNIKYFILLAYSKRCVTICFSTLLSVSTVKFQLVTF